MLRVGTTGTDLEVASGNSQGENNASNAGSNENIGNRNIDGLGAIVAQLRNIWSADDFGQIGTREQMLSNAQLNQVGSGIFSRKVFIGGLPPDIKSSKISMFFSQFGSNEVDWPHRRCTENDSPPNGYAFVVFANDRSVDDLVRSCSLRQGKLQILLKDGFRNIKVVQIRPWILYDQFYSITHGAPGDMRYSIFVGGVPRTTTASELARQVQRAVGTVKFVSLEVEFDTKYPKGAAQVVFDDRQTYVSAIAMRFIKTSSIEQEREMEVKPYLFEQMRCEVCHLVDTQYLCPEVCCLMYMCVLCWDDVHRRRGLSSHKPLVKGRTVKPLRNISNVGAKVSFSVPSLDHPNRSAHRPYNHPLCYCRTSENFPAEQVPHQFGLQESNLPRGYIG